MEQITDKRDLLLVNCGGTASQERQLDLALVRLKAEVMAERIHPDIARKRTIEAFDLWPAINSSNITSREHLQHLAAQIADWREKYRSIMIVMGTNTAVNVGAYLTFALGNGLDIPIAIVSAQRHQGRMGSDSMENITNTARVVTEAADLGMREVMLYSGRLGQTLLRAVGAEKASDNSFLIYQSLNIRPIAEITAHETRFSRMARRGVPPEQFQLRNNFTMEGLMPICIYPDFDPNFIQAVSGIKGCRAVVIETYETGNLPDYLLLKIEQIVKKGTFVVVVPAFNEPNLTYLMPKEEQNAVMAGAFAAPGNMTKPTLYTKIGYWLTYRDYLGVEDLGRFLDTDFVGEIPERDDLTHPE